MYSGNLKHCFKTPDIWYSYGKICICYPTFESGYGRLVGLYTPYLRFRLI